MGGLGGIGRSVCYWMADHGAKNLIVLSRSASTARETAGSFFAEMDRLGCKVRAIGCNIADESDLHDSLAACAGDMPPIRGVIQAAMVLQVCVQDYKSQLH